MKIKALGYILTTLLFLNFAYAEDKEEDLANRLPNSSSPAPAPISTGVSEEKQKEIDHALHDPSKETDPHKENNTEILGHCGKAEKSMIGFAGTSKYYQIAKKISVQCEEYKRNKPSCDKLASYAKYACLATLSGNIQVITAGAQMLLTTSTFAINDACGGMAKAVDNIQKGITAYQFHCDAERMLCENSCEKATNALKEFKKFTAESGVVLKAKCTPDDMNPREKLAIAAAPSSSTSVGYNLQDETSESSGEKPYSPIGECETAKKNLEEAVNGLSIQLKEELDVQDKASTAGKQKICEVDFAKMAGAAAVSAAALIKSYFTAKQCDKKTQVATALDCGDAKNASVPECICLKNPRSQGCPNSLAKAGGINNQSSSSPLASSTPTLTVRGAGGIGADGKSVDRDLASASAKAQGSDNVGGAQAGAPVGGGGGGSPSLSGKSAGSREVPGPRGKSTFDANVNGGYEGGGGVGGFRGFRSDQDAKKALANYQKNLNPIKVAAQAWAREVTPQSGRSNFEKVKARYNDNRRTLKGE